MGTCLHALCVNIWIIIVESTMFTPLLPLSSLSSWWSSRKTSSRRRGLCRCMFIHTCTFNMYVYGWSLSASQFASSSWSQWSDHHPHHHQGKLLFPARRRGSSWDFLHHPIQLSLAPAVSLIIVIIIVIITIITIIIIILFIIASNKHHFQSVLWATSCDAKKLIPSYTSLQLQHQERKSWLLLRSDFVFSSLL